LKWVSRALIPFYFADKSSVSLLFVDVNPKPET